MTQAANPALSHPRCQQPNCPHPRRQRNYRAASLVTVLAAMLVQIWPWPPDNPAVLRAALTALAIGLALLILSLSLPPVRHWLGLAQHVVRPDERETVIDNRARAMTLNAMAAGMPYLLLPVLLLWPRQQALIYTLIGLWAIVAIAPQLVCRWLDKRM